MGCFTCLKLLVSLLIFLLMLIGLAIIGLFTWIHLDLTILLSLDTTVTYLSYIMAAIAVLMVVMGFLGLCGVYQESQCLLGLYFSMTLLVLVGQLGFFSWAFLHDDQISADFKEQLQSEMKFNYANVSSSKIAIDQLQTKLHCCGAHSLTDFETGDGDPKQIFMVPESCCNTPCEGPAEVDIYGSNEHIYKQRCWDTLFGKLKRNRILAIMSLIITGLLEIFTLIFTMLLCLTVRKFNYYKP